MDRLMPLAEHPPEPGVRLRLQRARVPIAAGVLYPALGWLLNPMITSVAMALSSVSVIANALRLRNADLSSGRPESGGAP